MNGEALLAKCAYDKVQEHAANVRNAQKNAALVKAHEEALTPSADTKAAYMGEFIIHKYECKTWEGEDVFTEVIVPWTTIKEIMETIRKRAQEQFNEAEIAET